MTNTISINIGARVLTDPRKFKRYQRRVVQILKKYVGQPRTEAVYIDMREQINLEFKRCGLPGNGRFGVKTVSAIVRIPTAE